MTLNRMAYEDKKRAYDAFKKTTGMDENDVVSLVQAQSREGLTFVANYRNQLQADFVLYKNVKTGDDKIGDTTLFNKVNAMMARDYQEKPTVLFETADITQRDAVTNMNAVYKDDYEEDDLEVVNYYVRFFKYLFGVGIKAKTGWNGAYKRNVFNWVDPRIWVPDPDGDYVNGEFAYTGFEKMVDGGTLHQGGWMNLDKAQPMPMGIYSQTLQKYKDQQLDALPNMGTNNVTNPWFDLYYHFFKTKGVDGKEYKALAVLSNDRSNLLAVELLKPACKEEEKDPSLIPFPFSFHYWKPEPNNPFGNRPANYIRDVQKYKTLIANLRIKKAKAELYPMYFFNQRYIKNQSELTFGFNKFIAVNTGADGAVPIDSIVKPFRPDSSADNSFKIDQSLDLQVERSTSIGDNLLGAVGSGTETATEQNIVQSNADLNLAINSKIDNWGEKQFVRMWLHGYLENFADGDKKFTTVNTGLGSFPVQLTKRDFLVGMKVKIKIVSKGTIEAQRNKEKLAYSTVAAFVQNGNIPEVSKNIMLREMAIANGIDEQKVSVTIPKSPQEMLAERENALLLNGFTVHVNPDDDDVTHLILHSASGDSKEAVLHRMEHEKAYIKKGQPSVNNSNAGGMQAMMSQSASQMAGEQSKQQAQGASSITTA